VDDLSGGTNNDVIDARDGAGIDLVNCGLGERDVAYADERDGVSGDCERVIRTAS
jgi:hypothetical protein